MTFGKAETSASIASVVDFGLAIVLANVFHFWYAFASFLGALSGGIVNCCINYKWVFNAKGLNKKNIAFKYFLVWSISIILNTLGTYALTELSGINFIFVKALVALVVAILWNYQMQRLFVFK